MTEFYKSIKLINNSIIISSLTLLLIGLPSTVESNKYAEAVQEIESIKEVRAEIRSKEKDYLKTIYRDTLSFISKTFDDLPYEPIDFGIGSKQHYQIGDPNWGIDNIKFWGSFPFFKLNLGSELQSTINNKKLRKWYEETIKNSIADSWAITPSSEGIKIVLVKDEKIVDDKIFFITKPLGGQWADEKRKSIITEILDKNKLLIENIENSNIFIKSCPRLKNDEIWFDVKDKKLDEVELYLIEKSKDKKKSQTKPLSIFGFSIPSIYAWLIGPLIIISLLIFLAIHVNQLKIGIKSDKKLSYPWIGVYDGLLNRLVFIFIIFVLPCFASFLALNFSNLQSFEKLLIGLSYFIIISGLGYTIFKNTTAIISKIKESNISNKLEPNFAQESN